VEVQSDARVQQHMALPFPRKKVAVLNWLKKAGATRHGENYAKDF
jgi:hypothetical protein